MRMGEDRIVRKVYEVRAVRKKKKGRPRRVWLEDVKMATEIRNITWQEVKRKTQNRKEWKEIVKRKPTE